jgi:nucleoside 2-deoxyribosyltransferase
MAIKIYFAGPLFQPYERQWISEQAVRLRAAGYEVFVPHEQPKTDGPLTPKKCFDKDMEGLGPANVILAILDGVQTDDGTACEIGIFWAQSQTNPAKKKIIGLINDSRKQATNGPEVHDVNLFLAGAILDKGVYCYNMDQVMEELAKIKE